MTYRIHALPPEPFQPLFDLSDAELEALGARRMIADAPHAAPCRVSLADAEPGERLMLVNHRHLDAASSPYRSEGPIFVREGAAQADPAPGELPGMLTRRLLSARVYDADWLMIDAEVVQGDDLDARLRGWFANDATRTIHLHTARRGCFMAAATRA